MTFRQQIVAFAMAILVWVNLLTIALSSWQFGYIDSQTVATMGLMALPPLAVGALLLYCCGTSSRSEGSEIQ